MSVGLLKIRYFQIKRAYMPPLAIYIAICFITFFSIEDLNTVQVITLTYFPPLILLLYHNTRSDLHFIKMQFLSYKMEMMINYNLTLLPISLGLLWRSQWDHALQTHLIASTIALINTKSKPLLLLFLGRVIPSDHYEWISGARKQFILLTLLYLTSFALVMAKFFVLVPLFFFNLLIMDFYSVFEPRVMLNCNGTSTKEFLGNKIQFSTKMFLTTNIPILAINSLFNHEMLSINSLFVLSGLLSLVGAIYIKYALYVPNDQLRINTDLILLSFALLVPYLLPITIILIYVNRKKALNNLKNYIDDQS